MLFSKNEKQINGKDLNDMAKKVGTLIKEARTAAGLSQEQRIKGRNNKALIIVL